MITWFEIKKAKKQSRADNVLLKTGLVVLCISFSLYLIDSLSNGDANISADSQKNTAFYRSPEYPLAEQDQKRAVFPTQKIARSMASTEQKPSVLQTMLKQKKQVLRELRMHNTLRGTNRRGNLSTSATSLLEHDSPILDTQQHITINSTPSNTKVSSLAW